jgi:hypothetical protein
MYIWLYLILCTAIHLHRYRPLYRLYNHTTHASPWLPLGTFSRDLLCLNTLTALHVIASHCPPVALQIHTREK